MQDIEAALNAIARNYFSPATFIRPAPNNFQVSANLKALKIPDRHILQTNQTAKGGETSSLYVTSNLEHNIISAADINSTNLQDFLLNKKWQQADKETRTLLCQCLSVTPETKLEISQIYQLPCEDLQTADRLWEY